MEKRCPKKEKRTTTSLRPTTTAFLPSISMPVDRINSRTPLGVHGTKSGCVFNLASRPILVVWNLRKSNDSTCELDSFVQKSPMSTSLRYMILLPIDILDGIDSLCHNLGVDVCGQGQLYKDSVHRWIRVQVLDRLEQLGLGGALGQVVLRVLDSGLLTCLLLHRNVYIRVLLLAQLYNRESWLKGWVECLELLDFRFDVLHDRSK